MAEEKLREGAVGVLNFTHLITAFYAEGFCGAGM